MTKEINIKGANADASANVHEDEFAAAHVYYIKTAQSAHLRERLRLRLRLRL